MDNFVIIAYYVTCIFSFVWNKKNPQKLTKKLLI